MTETTTRDQKLVQYLNEAYATERRLEIALQAHIAMTPRRDYKARLRDHLKETKAHARNVAKRIKQLGGEAETITIPGPEPLAKGVRAAKTAMQQAVAVAQGPVHAVRGTGPQERMLKNARTEFQDEAEEIATYRAIEGLAKGVGDKETAKLAKQIRREEERMQAFLGRQLVTLSGAVVREEVPARERKPGGAKPARKRRTTKSRATATKKPAARKTSARTATNGRTTASRRRTRAKAKSS